MKTLSCASVQLWPLLKTFSDALVEELPLTLSLNVRFEEQLAEMIKLSRPESLVRGGSTENSSDNCSNHSSN